MRILDEFGAITATITGPWSPASNGWRRSNRPASPPTQRRRNVAPGIETGGHGIDAT
jgi:hypothetical protein